MKFGFLFACLIIFMCTVIGACKNDSDQRTKTSLKKISWQLQSHAPDFEKIFDEDARLEVLANGFGNADGPVWLDKKQMLLFTEVSKNQIYKWSKEGSSELYLSHTGGASGLAVRGDHELILCQQADQAVSVLASPLGDPKPNYIKLAETFKKLDYNSPSDLFVDSKGIIYFTDPPKSDNQKLSWNGVYKLYKNGLISMMTSKLSYPEGVVYLEEKNEVIVANGDLKDAKWYKIKISPEDKILSKEIFYDPVDFVTSKSGLPDGMALHKDGYIFATGPGGLWIFTVEGNLVGKIKTDEILTNCTFDKDQKYLYITSENSLLRFNLSTASI